MPLAEACNWKCTESGQRVDHMLPPGPPSHRPELAKAAAAADDAAGAAIAPSGCTASLPATPRKSTGALSSDSESDSGSESSDCEQGAAAQSHDGGHNFLDCVSEDAVRLVQPSCVPFVHCLDLRDGVSCVCVCVCVRACVYDADSLCVACALQK